MMLTVHRVPQNGMLEKFKLPEGTKYIVCVKVSAEKVPRGMSRT